MIKASEQSKAVIDEEKIEVISIFGYTPHLMELKDESAKYLTKIDILGERV